MVVFFEVGEELKEMQMSDCQMPQMGSGQANLLTLTKNRYKNRHNLVLGDQFWYQNPPL